jgi:hypothetical protein
VANVTFNGVVSAQAAPGETVTVTVTLPDTTTDTLTATTDNTGAYTATKTYTTPGSYSAVAAVPADAQYDAAQSPLVPFTIAVANRTVTLNVSLA